MATASQPAAPGRAFKLVIEDERQAVWMAINSSFAKSPIGNPWNTPMEHGILIQLGKSRRWPDEFIMDPVLCIEFWNGNVKGPTIDKLELEDPESMWWINVRGVETEPMKPKDLDALRLTVPHSLHKYFKPYRGGITLWPGEKTDIGIRPAEHESVHRSYEFTLQALHVDVYRNGDKVKQDAGQSDRIVIRYSKNKPPDGETWNPPQYP